MSINSFDTKGPEPWTKDPKTVERARIVLAISLSKKTADELVHIIMKWLDDKDIYRFCRKFLDESDLAYIEGRSGKS
jgi:hypothetical protein